MKETKFIEQNKEKWLKFEQLLRLNKRDPDKLSDLFIQITDDLSYARTNYPNRSIRVYLNNLAQQLFYNIYKNKKESRNKFVNFWKEELPSVVFYCRYELFTALVVFLLAFAIGVLSSVYDPEFARSILGDSYVDMTINNIEDGDPMGVYKSSNEVDMFLSITLNNVRVAFLTFITGILASLGAIIVLVYNGIMVGTFQFFFIERGLGVESFLSIWLHGTLEISSIVIAGAAGIVLGKGFVFPGTHSRIRAFQLSARRGLKLLIGIVPILVFAALIESFVTRYTELPDMVKLTLILVSLFFMVFYFVWVPFSKHRNGTLQPLRETRLQSRNLKVPTLEGKIRKVNEIFRDAVLIYQRIVKPYFKSAILLTLVYLAGAAFVLREPIGNSLIYVDSWFFKKLSFLIDYQEYPALFFVNLLFLAGIVYLTLLRFPKYHAIKLSKQRALIAGLFASFLINMPFFINGFFSFFFWVLIMPMALFCTFIYLKEQISLGSAISRVSGLWKETLGRALGLYALLLFIGFTFFVLTDTPFFAFYMEFIQANFVLDPETTYHIGLVINGLVMTLGLAMVIPFFLLGFSIQYYTLVEIKEAVWLKEQISNFGKRKDV
ncbi:stage II sporulation protein M [Fulvivirga sp. 29W222]|uniref:Stage II sporulation protein M n=1 Tax=Fulvivirga marina TaxID=2494733 RepID=A0A937FTG6_9BACT|nr:stage II sporulation protein M [Fulvivirga marina]MBL6445570.1 stage II sporulation protein M [Fulvivirga marina]